MAAAIAAGLLGLGRSCAYHMQQQHGPREQGAGPEPPSAPAVAEASPDGAPPHTPVSLTDEQLCQLVARLSGAPEAEAEERVQGMLALLVEAVTAGGEPTCHTLLRAGVLPAITALVGKDGQHETANLAMELTRW